MYNILKLLFSINNHKYKINVYILFFEYIKILFCSLISQSSTKSGNRYISIIIITILFMLLVIIIFIINIAIICVFLTVKTAIFVTVIDKINIYN